MLSPQLALNVSIRDGLSFDNFYSNADSREAVIYLRNWQPTEVFQSIALWGGAGSGRSHLLQAVVSEWDRLGRSTLYLPCQELLSMDPEALLHGLEGFDLIALDDIEALAGHRAWEHALFALYNALHDRGGNLLLSSLMATTDLPFVTADVISRLAWGMTFKLPNLSDNEKIEALQLRAKGRGMVMADEVAKYILSRSSREFSQLLSVLDTLDSATIEAQRKLTVPFVRSVCHW